MSRPKRRLADELIAGIQEMQQHHTGKLTLRTHKVAARQLPRIIPPVILANATHRTWEMSRDAYMDVSGRATQEPKPRTGRPKQPEASRTNPYCAADTLELFSPKPHN